MTDIRNVTGIGPSLSALLNQHGISTAPQLAAKTPTDLTAIPGIGQRRAETLLAAAGQVPVMELAEPIAAPEPARDEKVDQKAQKAKKKKKSAKTEKKSKTAKKTEKKPETKKSKAKSAAAKKKSGKKKSGKKKPAKKTKAKSK